MKARIVDGRVFLDDMRVDEAKLLHEALDSFTSLYIERATELEIRAGEKLEAARNQARCRRAAARVAGELRNEAAALRALARDGADLLRALGWAATHKDAR